MNTQSILDKIKKVKIFYTDSQLAESLGKSKQNINSYRAGKADLRLTDVVDFAKENKIDLNWLLLDIDPSNNDLVREPSSEYIVGATKIKILDYGVSASAGNGFIAEPIENGTYYIDVSELTHFNPKAKPEGIFVIRVRGDSMYPELLPNDRVLIEPYKHNGAFVEGVYLFRFEDAVFLKVLRRVRGGVFDAISFNKEYPTFQIEAHDDFEILGRLCGKFKHY